MNTRIDSKEFQALSWEEKYQAVCRRLEDLTPSGSEFHNNPEKCITYAIDRIKSLVEQNVKLMKRIKSQETQ